MVAPPCAIVMLLLELYHPNGSLSRICLAYTGNWQNRTLFVPSRRSLSGVGLFFLYFLPQKTDHFGIFPPVGSEGLAFRLEVNMTNEQRTRITSLRHQGYGYTAIANVVGLSKDSVKAYCRKHGLGGKVASTHTLLEVSPEVCLCCGKQIVQRPKVKKRKFCSSDCRINWYKANPGCLHLKAVYEYICPTCGKHFSAYGNNHRKYCSHACYIAGRFQSGDGA